MCELLTKKLNRNTSNSAINILASARTRLCAYILNDKMGLLSNLTLVANTLGISYRHTLRTVKSLCLDGSLTKTKKGYVIADYDLVAKYANDLEPTLNSN